MEAESVKSSIKWYREGFGVLTGAMSLASMVIRWWGIGLGTGLQNVLSYYRKVVEVLFAWVPFVLPHIHLTPTMKDLLCLYLLLVLANLRAFFRNTSVPWPKWRSRRDEGSKNEPSDLRRPLHRPHFYEGKSVKWKIGLALCLPFLTVYLMVVFLLMLVGIVLFPPFFTAYAFVAYDGTRERRLVKLRFEVLAVFLAACAILMLGAFSPF